MKAGEFTAPAPAGSRPVEYASFARRLGAALLDSLVWLIAFTFFNPLPAFADDPAVAAVVAIVIFSLWFNYFAFCEWRWGQTIGKNATGIRVLPLDGGSLSWQAAALRNLLRIVDLPLAMIGADYVIVRQSPRRQRLGDRAAKTIVVRERVEEEAGGDERSVRSGIQAAGARPDDSPTAAEIFGEAAEALGRHPAAGSAPGAGPGREEVAAIEEPAPPRPSASEERDGVAAWATWGPGLALGGIVSALLAAVVLSIPVAVVDPDVGTDDASVAANTIAQLIQTALLIAVPVVLVSRSDQRLRIGDALARLGIRRFAPSAFGWMALAVVVYLVLASISFVLFDPHQEDIAQDFGPVPLQVLLVALAAPVSEEISFRGFLFGGLRSRMPAIAAALLSGALFGALHAPSGLGTVPQLIAFGAIMALLYEKTGSIVPGLMLHVLNNSVGLLAS